MNLKKWKTRFFWKNLKNTQQTQHCSRAPVRRNEMWSEVCQQIALWNLVRQTLNMFEFSRYMTSSKMFVDKSKRNFWILFFYKKIHVPDHGFCGSGVSRTRRDVPSWDAPNRRLYSSVTLVVTCKDSVYVTVTIIVQLFGINKKAKSTRKNQPFSRLWPPIPKVIEWSDRLRSVPINADTIVFCLVVTRSRRKWQHRRSLWKQVCALCEAEFRIQL